jgi:hypothetical protein
LILLPCLANSQTDISESLAPSVPPAPASQIVGEMLQLDAQRALASEREKLARSGLLLSPPASLVANSAVSHPDSAPQTSSTLPSLQAIYGMGNILHADVLIQGKAVTFRNGRSAPVRGDAAGYRLASISGGCVKLRSAADDPALVEVCDARLSH